MAKISAKKAEAVKKVAARSGKEHKAKTLKSVGVWSNDGVARNTRAMKDMVSEIIELIKAGEKYIEVDDGNRKYTASLTEVAVLQGNTKLGKAIWTVSLPPVLYCGNCKQCKNLCYDLRHDVIQLMCRVYRCINAALLEVKGIDWWMNDVERQVEEKGIEFLRWFIGGDIVSRQQLNRMVLLAINHRGLHQLVFTKMYELVNEYFNEVTINGVHCSEYGNKMTEEDFERAMDNGEYPVQPFNLHLFFSAWPGTKMENPYNFPISFPVYDDEDTKTNDMVAAHMAAMPKFYWHCGNDCTDCALSGCGCWKLKRGEAVGFPLH